MCIISGFTSSVAKTKILVAPSEDGKRQLTVYRNNVTMNSNGSMVLPFPNHDQNCTLVDLSNYPTLFSDLNRIFPMPLSAQSYGVKSKGYLDVQQVGSYKACVANDVKELELVDRTVFQIDDDVLEFVKSNYGQGNFGVVVCQLDKDKSYHPFGYIHSRLTDTELFIPTMHYHKHVGFNNVSSDWDHAIYGFDCAFPNIRCPRDIENAEGLSEYVDFTKLPIKPPEKCAWRATVNDYNKNHDLVVKVC
jgi:hypothetical protein